MYLVLVVITFSDTQYQVNAYDHIIWAKKKLWKKRNVQCLKLHKAPYYINIKLFQSVSSRFLVNKVVIGSLLRIVEAYKLSRFLQHKRHSPNSQKINRTQNQILPRKSNTMDPKPRLRILKKYSANNLRVNRCMCVVNSVFEFALS